MEYVAFNQSCYEHLESNRILLATHVEYVYLRPYTRKHSPRSVRLTTPWSRTNANKCSSLRGRL